MQCNKGASLGTMIDGAVARRRGEWVAINTTAAIDRARLHGSETGPSSALCLTRTRGASATTKSTQVSRRQFRRSDTKANLELSRKRWFVEIR
jgi:hypothetical protein